jgi:hypothetical protein
MTFSEKIEQTFTGRPNSYVPAQTLARLLRLPPTSQDSKSLWLNHAMHYGQGALAGGFRGVMSAYGIVGFFANFMFTAVRLGIDQTLENATQVGAPPW